jgi:RHS repeat-associated protein
MNGYLTTYSYSFISPNLKTVVTQASQARTYLYDLAGRLVSEQNPESGLTQYFFDSGPDCTGSFNGDLVERKDARGNITCYTYDLLHRVLSMSYSGIDAPNTPVKTFVYDSATVNGVAMSNAKGHLAEAYTGSSGAKITDEGFVYSTVGQVTEVWESTPHSGTYYHPTASFWNNGALKSVWISALPVISYGADGEGRTSTVSAASGQNPVTATSYNVGSQVTGVTFGSADSDSFTFDPNTGRMTQYKFNVNTQSVIGNTSWNSNGSLAQLAIANPVNTADAQTCNYTHDDLARIATVNCGTTKWTQNFSYDVFGNISKTVPAGGTGSSFQATYSSTTNWISSLPGVTPATDNDGRLTYDGAHTYGWDAESKMYAVDTTTLTVDALGRAVEKNVSGTFTQIVYGPLGNKFAQMSGTTLQKAFVPLPSGTAVYTGAGLAYYRHQDHLGSSRFATTPTRTMYSSTSYAPYGELYAQAGTTDLSFAGADQDTTNGMHDFIFRKYSPVEGRWLSPDPAGTNAVDETDPQTWDRYSYTRNSPLNEVDPLGLTHYLVACQQNPGDRQGGLGYYGDVTYNANNNQGDEFVYTAKVIEPVNTDPRITCIFYADYDPGLFMGGGAEGNTPDSGGGSGTPTPPKPCTCLNKDDFANALDGNALSKSSRQCATFVRMALEAAGLNTKGHPAFAGNYGPFLSGKGFDPVSMAGYTPETGDIIVFGITDQHTYGHIAGYDGSQWVSDFKQHNANPYRDPSSAGPATIYRNGCKCD